MLPWHELADNSTCVRLGLSDATMLAARDAIPLSSPYSSPLQFFLPIFSSKVDSPSQAFVWLHGLGGNANDYYCNGVATAATAESSLETLSVAPWFASEQVTLDDWLGSARADDWRRRNNWTTGGKSIYWGPHRGGWMRGADSSPEWERYTTSFDAFDATVQWLRLSHPTLKNTSAVGFSAGSQFLSRWAFFSQEMEIGSNITSVISDPGSYLYLERRRPASTCRPLEDTGANHTCDSFLVPDAAGCPDFDEYKYGLSNLGGSLYLEKFAANATLLEQVSMATHERGLPAQLSASARPRRHAPPLPIVSRRWRPTRTETCAICSASTTCAIATRRDTSTPKRSATPPIQGSTPTLASSAARPTPRAAHWEGMAAATPTQTV